MSATIEAVTQNKNDIPWNKHVRQKQKPGDWAVSGIINVLLLLTIVAVLYPLWFVVIASFSNPNAVAGGEVLLLPKDVTFAGYAKVFANQRIWQGYLNTIIYSVVGTAVNMAVTIPCAFALSRREFKPRRVIMFLFTVTLMVGTAGLPHVIIRFFTVPNIRDARWSAAWALVFIALFYTTVPALAAMSRLNLIETFYPNGTKAAPLVYDERPEWVKNWEQTGLLKFEDKNNDGRVQFYNGANKELTTTAEHAKTWNGNELTVNNDILVLALPEVANMPAWLIGLMAAGGIAAALSTASGLLMAISSAVSHDLLKNTLMPHLTEKQELLNARLAMVGAILIATWLGLNPPGFAAQTVALAFGMAAATIFPALVLGIFVERVNAKGVIAGMLAGGLATVTYIFMYLGWFFIPGTANFPNTPDNWLFGISPLSFGVIGAVINIITTLVVSNVTEAPSEELREMVRRVRYP